MSSTDLQDQANAQDTDTSSDTDAVQSKSIGDPLADPLVDPLVEGGEGEAVQMGRNYLH